MKSEVITITGFLGSGKSSTANGLAKALDYKRFSAGDFQRAAAESLGLTYEEYQKVAEQDQKYDHAADNALTEAGKQEKSVIDARLGYHFVPQSFKVFLTLPPEIAAERILQDAKVNPNRNKELIGGATDHQTIVRGITERRESERHRYEKYYGIKDMFDTKNFDLVVDTSKHPLEEVVAIILERYKEWLAN